MNNINLKLAVTLALSILTTSTFAQFNWELGGNNGIPPNAVNATNNILGTASGANFPLRIATNGTQKALFTVGNFMNDGIGGLAGDGLRISPNPSCSGCAATIDIATGTGNGSFIKFPGHNSSAGHGVIRALNNRFEYYAHLNGFWFNADGISGTGSTGIAQYIYNINGTELSDKNIIVLNQNVPNPFAEQTTITYNIPEQFSFAQILFYDMNGRMIKAVDVKEKGRGQLNVFANDLSNGIYSYTLVIDGKIIDTKKMVKQD